MADLITVRSTTPTKPDGGNVVALYETHPDHPDGAAYVAGPTPVQVARTPTVQRAISDGRLEEVHETPATAPAASAQTRPAAMTTTSPSGSALDTPGLLTDAQRDALAAAGFFTPADIRAASDDDLTAVDGIGPATVQRLRDAVKE